MMNTMRPYLRIALITSLIALVPFISGCVGVGIGIATAGLIGLGPERERIRGDIDGTLSVDYPIVVAAAADVINELQFTKVVKNEDVKQSTTEFEAETLQNRSLSIKISKEGVNLTKVRVHMQIFGDRDTSTAVLNKIRLKVHSEKETIEPRADKN